MAARETKHYIAYILFTATVGVLLLLNWLGVFKTVFGVDTAILLSLFGGYKIYYNAISALFEKRISADLAILLAIGAALAIGENVAAAEAVFIMLIGEGLEEFASRRARSAIERLIELSPKTARIRVPDQQTAAEREVQVEEVRLDDVVIVRPGERIPVDGRIAIGRSSINEAPITGESLPVDKAPGDSVFAGSVNTTGALDIVATSVGPNTTLARIIALIEEADAKRAPIERTADRYAKFFLPALLLAAGGTLYFTGEWVRAVAVLLVGCPCALILATPAAVVAAIGRLARDGVLVRSGEALEAAARVECFVFDKTGTITEGRLEIVGIVPFETHSEREVLQMAALAEQGSTHPIAKLIVKEAKSLGLAIPLADEVMVEPGLGVSARVDGQSILVGNRRMMEARGIAITERAEASLASATQQGASLLLVADGSVLQGLIGVRDTTRDDARETVARLKSSGIKRIALVTGDRKNVALDVAQRAGIDDVHYELLPQDKVELVERIERGGLRVAMVGDGINDAPALASASVGIAMGEAGTDVTIEEADVVLMNDRLDRLPLLLDVSRATLAIITQNILIFALAVNLVSVVAAALGLLGPVGAAAAHQVSALLVVLNSLRLLSYGRLKQSRFALRASAAWSSIGLSVQESTSAINVANARQWTVKRRALLLKWSYVSVLLLYILSGVYFIGPDEAGVARRFGRKLMPARGPGIHYRLPWPIDQISRVKPNQIQVSEIGFRTVAGSQLVDASEPQAYEWNIQHRTGRYEKRQDEALMLTGDENLVEVNAVVQYSVSSAEDYLFATADPANVIRVASESVIRSVVGANALDRVLTGRRAEVEREVKDLIQRAAEAYGIGVRIVAVQLQDVHPSVEVVDAFRSVATSFEEKNKLINDAEGYRNEQVQVSRGTASAQLAQAASYTTDRTNRSEGDAQRFTRALEAFKLDPNVTETRLYLETIEQVLAGKKKMIIDGSKFGRKQMLFVDPQGIPLELGKAPNQ